MCESCIDERGMIGSGGGSEMGSSVFLRKTEHLDRCHLSILGSASRGFQESYSASEPATEIRKGPREQCFSPDSEVEPSLLEQTLLLLLIFTPLAPCNLKPVRCDPCAPSTSSSISLMDGRVSSSSPPHSLRSSLFEVPGAVIEGLPQSKTVNVTFGA